MATTKPWMVLGTVLLAAACGSNDNGGTSTSSSACSDLAARCSACTLPSLKSTCESAVASQDPASCQDGLNDPDIQTNCVPSGGGGSSAGGASNNGGSSANTAGSSAGGASNSGGGSANTAGSSAGGASNNGGSSAGGGCASLCSHTGTQTIAQASCVALQSLTQGYNWSGNSTCMAITTPAQCIACTSDLSMPDSVCASVESTCF